MDELSALLIEKNGFYAFESALLLRPSGITETPILTIGRWNLYDTWKSSYVKVLDSATFFAEDVFGCQFGIAEERIVAFNPESGELERFADTLEDWAARVLDDFGVLTGYPLAHEWQATQGPLKPGFRLVPRIPFVLGGDFTVANLRVAQDVRAMRYYGSLSTAIASIPDGREVRLNLESFSEGLDA